MSTPVTLPGPLADACPVCHPGENDAARPAAVALDGDGTLSASYGCPACGCSWRTFWSLSDVWPVRQEVDTPPEITPEQAAANARALAVALNGTGSDAEAA